MKKLMNRLLICAAISAVIWCITLIRDRQTLNEELIRLHVIANSDSEEDQNVKLQVRDAILESLEADLAKVKDVNAAKLYLQENLPKLQTIANQVLDAAGFEPNAVAELCAEAFPTRYYDTFKLPAGVYETLKITIGEGSGKNWWCVAFPGLCVPATSDGFAEAAVEAGLSEDLSESLTNEDPFEIRFYLLDAMGKLKTRFFQES